MTSPSDNIIAVDWSKHRNKRSAYISNVQERTVRPLPFDGSLEQLLELAATLTGGTVIGIDAAIGMPAATWEQLTTSIETQPAHFLQYLKSLRADSRFFTPVDNPADWRPNRPFIAPKPGKWSRLAYEKASLGGIHRNIDRVLKANPVFVMRGIPGSVGSGTHSLWRELIGLHASHRFSVWPFDGTLETLVNAEKPVIAEIYPKACYGIAINPTLPAPLRSIAKTKTAARKKVIAELLAAQWIERERFQIQGIDNALASEDDFDALLSVLALTRLVLEKAAFESDATTDSIAEGGVLGAANVELRKKKGRRQKRQDTRENHLLKQAKPPKAYPCPIPGCNKVFHGSRGGWDGHVGSARLHPSWHPSVTDLAERRARFRAQFGKWFD